MMLYRSGLWLFLVACAAAFDNYDDTRPVDFGGDAAYHDGSYLDPGQLTEDLQEDQLKDIMIFKLISALQNKNNDDLDLRYRPNLSLKDPDLFSWDQASNEDNFKGFKNIMFKRPAPIISAPVRGVKQKPVARKQPSWKKKGKILRHHMVCYFKLCAFRSPY